MKTLMNLPTRKASITALFRWIGLILFIVGALPQSARAASLLTAPVIANISPADVINDINTEVILTGAGFSQEDLPQVLFDGQPLAQVTRLDAQRLAVTLHWGATPGEHFLRVRNPDGQESEQVVLRVINGFNQWMTYGPYGGQVHRVIVDPQDTSRLYASMRDVGIFRSTDRGEHWEIVLATNNNTDLAWESGSLYAVTTTQGLVRSNDGGDTWTALNNIWFSPHQSLIYASPFFPGKVFISDNGNFRVTIDQGQTWQDESIDLPEGQRVTAITGHPQHSGWMYVGLSNGTVLLKEDPQSDWRSLGQPDLFIYRLLVHPATGDLWACGSDDNGHWGFLWVLKPGETQWQQVSQGLAEPRVLDLALGLDGRLWAVTFMSTSYSADFGETWLPAGPTPTPGSPNTVTIDPLNPQIVYQGFSGSGVYRTLDGGQHWVEMNQGLAAVQPSGIAVHPQDSQTLYVTAHGPGTFKMTQAGSSWKKVPSWNSWARTPLVDLSTPQRVYVGATNNILVTEDDGETWLPAPQPIPVPQGYDGYRPEIADLIQLPGSNRLVLAVGFIPENAQSSDIQGGAIYISEGSDRGTTWTEAMATSKDLSIRHVRHAPSQPQTVYAGGTGMWKSIDGGSTWASFGLDGKAIHGIAVDDQDPDKVFVSTSNAIFAWSAEQQQWQQASAETSWMLNGRLLWVPAPHRLLFVYSWQGILQSADEGQTWHRAPGTLAYSNIGALNYAVDGERLTLYIGTSGGLVSNSGSGLSLASSQVIGAGIYRYTTIKRSVYLPSITRP